MSAPVTPTGALPRCTSCEEREKTAPPEVCHHLAGDPVNRPAWFHAQHLAKLIRIRERAEAKEQKR